MNEHEKTDGMIVGVVIGLGVVLLGGLVACGLFFVRYQKAREQERRALIEQNLAAIGRALEKTIGIIGEVESWEPASSEVCVNASPPSVHAPFWIVKFAVVDNPGNNYPLQTCNVLVHSPLDDLGVHSAGQKMRLILRRDDPAPKLTASSDEELARVVFADPNGPLILVSHQAVE